jgi:hypothetical protein
VFSDGLPGLLAVAENRVPLAYLPALHQWPIVLPLGLFFVGAILTAVRATEGRTRDLVLGGVLAIAVSLLVNDSGSYELASGAGVIAALTGLRTSGGGGAVGALTTSAPNEVVRSRSG